MNKLNEVWGDIGLEQKDFTMVPFLLTRNMGRLGINGNACAMIMVLMSYKWDSRNPFPSIPTLAGHLGWSERTVQRTLKEMEAVNLLKREFRRHGQDNDTSVFDLSPLFEKMLELTRETQKAPVVEQAAPAPAPEQRPLTPEEAMIMKQARLWIPTSVLEDFLNIEPGTRNIPLGAEELAHRIKNETTDAELLAALRGNPNCPISDAKHLARMVVEQKHGPKLRALAQNR